MSVYCYGFWHSGRIVVWPVCSTIMLKTFPGRSVIRGLLLFPYVAPVIAVAFSWVVLFDPFSGVVNTLLLQVGFTGAQLIFLASVK